MLTMMAVAIMYVAGIVVVVAMVEVEGWKGLRVEFVMMGEVKRCALEMSDCADEAPTSGDESM